MTDKEFRKEEKRIQEKLLHWVVERDREKQALLKLRTRLFMGNKLFEDYIVLYSMSHCLVESCLEGVRILNNSRRIRFELWCLKRGIK